MQIEQITITQTELNEAVQQWLVKRGLDLIVSDVSKSYASSGGFKVEIEVKEPQQAVPVIKSVAELGTAIEEGKV